MNTIVDSSTSSAAAAALDTELSNKYQQKTDKAHILDNPDTYIGSVEQVDDVQWILSPDGTRIVQKVIKYIPGLFKLFDEGIVNCRDHVIRMLSAANGTPVTNIDITIEADGTIVMMNDGNGIDVAEHPEYKIWIPELIFGHLRTSTNYDKAEKKIVGGKNGFGFKLVLIWSTYGSVETVDHVRGLRYRQEFKSNLDEICKPSVTKSKLKPYTKITFKPDYARLGIDGLSEDTLSLLRKRVYDVAAVTDKSIKVKYNSHLIPVKCFQQYIDLYIGDKATAPRVHEEDGERWEFAAALSPTGEFLQVSFVNGIHTAKGGKHVEYILSQITRKLIDYIEKKKKVRVNPNSIKEQLILFLRCDIENPAFDSQTKDYMNTPSLKFGSKCEVSEKFIEKLAKMGVMDAACAITEVKESKVAKKTDGVKSKSIRGIPKLTDANWAGTDKSAQCVIIFCEGDSAKAGIISGLSSDDRNTIGVYPMKGKILNVRGESKMKIAENKEITEIKKILGLETGKQYENMEEVCKCLRYGKVLFMTDQDLDGSHIKGLGINLFQTEWSSLTEITGFIGFMNTPILKANKGATTLMFYNDGEYEEWKKSNDLRGWKIKYYKGLGTSTGKEFREYFEQKKIVGFEHNGEQSNNAIDMVFNKKRADDRKVWLEDYNRESYLDTNKPSVTYDEFIHRELIHFSKYDCDRSIPNLMDGLKTSLRKILFAAFKKNLTSEIKVAQFTGYVSEHSCYHHGEASLNGAIVGMAQNFVGSNNINLLVPSGQFGTRLQGGSDSASERYIFTMLTPITRTLFPAADDNILSYLSDDGTPVEPVFYAPIIPMVLVNGSKGIGTGFSTDIISYNPLDIINYLREKLMMSGVSSVTFLPYYEGFKGTIEKISDGKFLIKGRYEKVGPDKIRVTELPVGYWTESFKEHLENLIDPGMDKTGKKIPPTVRDYDDMSKDTTVDFTITLQKGKMEELEAMLFDHNCNGIDKVFKLCTTNSSSNMHLFNAQDKLKKYASVEEIIDDYFVTRLQMYQSRKDFMIQSLQKDLVLLSNRAKYIQENLEGTIDLRKRKREEVTTLLEKKGYDVMDNDIDFKYLTKMPMDSVTSENVEKIFREHGLKQQELETVKATTANQMWVQELNNLAAAYSGYKEDRQRLMSGVEEVKKKKSVSSSSSSTTTKKKMKTMSLLDEDK
jgi:DNA topoisomerase-2